MLKLLRALTLFALAAVVPACGSGGGDTNIFDQIADPADASGTFVLLNDQNQLVFFVPGPPLVVYRILTLNGFNGAEFMESVDFRSSTGDLFGVTNAGQLVRIDPHSGTCVYLANVTFLAGTPPTMHFNAQLDRIELAGPNGHFSVDPESITSNNSSTFTPATTPAAVACLPGAVVTKYAVTSTSNLVTYTDAGAVTVVGPLTNAVVGGRAGFHISADGRAWLATVPFLGSSLYSLNLATGATTLVNELPAVAVWALTQVP